MTVGTLVALATVPALAVADENPLYRIVSALGSYKLKYTPQEWSEWTFKERVLNYDWSREYLVFATLVVYLGFYFWGSRKNKQLVTRFVGDVDPVLNSNFALVGAHPRQPIVKDSTTRYTTYASGRVNIESILTRFRLVDRQNIVLNFIGMLVPTMRGAEGADDYAYTVLTPTDASAVEPGVFAIVNKENLAETREDNYFLRATKTVDSTDLPKINYTFMYEHREQATQLYIPELHAALALPGAEKVFQSIMVSDLPVSEPTKIEDVSAKPAVYLYMRFPSTHEEDEAVAKIVEAALLFVDNLVEKTRYRPEILKRFKATRESEVAKIRRVEEEARKEELEAKKAEERREAARRERNLSEKEQRKLQKKEQDKQARKQRQKMNRRG